MNIIKLTASLNKGKILAALFCTASACIALTTCSASERPIIHASLLENAAHALQRENDLAQLRSLARASKGKIDKLYLHWSACKYTQAFPAYHINIGRLGEIYITCNEFTEYKPHTWHRNSRAIGISMDCMYGGDYDLEKDNICWGSQPPTKAQMESMAKVVRVVADELGLAITKDNVMSHYEAAILDKYAPGDGDPETRWDLMRLINPYTGKEVNGTEMIRQMAMILASENLRDH